MATTNIPLAKAINAALDISLTNDPKVIVMGEDIGALGGVFRVTADLAAKHGSDRVVDTPLAESGIVGTAIGLALRGYRPVCEIQFDGFIFPAFNQITTQLAKLHSRSRGRLKVPVVIRVPYGGGIGAVEHHSESPEALFAHTAGLRVVSPSNAADAYVMLQEAIACDDPVLYFEPKGHYWDKGEVDLSAGTYAAGVTPSSTSKFPTLNKAQVVREGTDVTVIGYGPTVSTALKVAQSAQQENISIEVIDLRALSPIDFDTLRASVEKTGRCVVVHEAPVFYGPGAEIAARLSHDCFYHLEAPIARVGGFHTPYPPAKLEHEYLPSLERVMDAVDRVLSY